MIDKDKSPPSLMNYEEFNRRIEYLRLGIENENLRRLLARVIDLADPEELKKREIEDEEE